MMWNANLKAICFDYGNTLIEFTAAQVHALDHAIGEALAAAFGPFDHQQYRRLRTQAYRAPYFHPQLRESSVADLVTDLVRQLHGVEATAEAIGPIVAAHDSFFETLIQPPDYLQDLLPQLRRKYKLAVVSNYPCGPSIRRSLRSTGLDRHMDAIVVSGEVGYVKPHPSVFQRAVDELGVRPHEAVFIGDNWLGDVQGAKRFGMRAIHTLQFDTLEKFDREEGHHDADLTIRDLRELLEHL